MAFAPIFFMMKQTSLLDPQQHNNFNKGIFYLSNAGAYALAGSWAGYRFDGNATSIGLWSGAFGLISGILSMGIIHESNTNNWSTERLKAALSTADLIIDAALLATIVTIKDLVRKDGIGIAAALLAVDAAIATYHGIQSCRANAHDIPPRQNLRDVERDVDYKEGEPHPASVAIHIASHPIQPPASPEHTVVEVR